MTPATSQQRATSTPADLADPQRSWIEARRAGDFERAWRVSDGVLQARVAAGEPCWHWPRHLQWVWRGESLAGKRVFVRCYHGLGDTIQFIRYATPLREVASEVVVWAQPQLLELVASVPGVDRVLPLHDGAPDYPYDVDVEIMELSHALRLAPDALRGGVPYLSPPPGRVPLLRDGRPVIGIVWKAGDWDGRRSVPAAVMRRLGTLPGCHVVSLQRGDGIRELGETGAADLSTDDVGATARLIQRLDLVVTVDTMVAHLAGALGVPVWTMLHSDADWRWMAGRDDSPWYPTMRLFRQRRAGDWETVMDDVLAALAERFG